MVAMFLEFTVIISLLLNFSSGPCISIGVVNKIGYEETTSMEVTFEPLSRRLSHGLGLGNRVRVMGVWSMKLCCLFETFQLACPLVDFSHSKTTSHYNVA
jgi:hypothetical protein